MIKVNRIKLLLSLLLFSPCIAFSASLSSGQQEKIMQQHRTSEKYSCTPDELSSFIKVQSAPLYMKTNAPSADEHITNQMMEAAKEGVESCFPLFQNLDVIKNLEKLMDQLNNLDPTAGLPSSDMIMTMLKELSKKMYEEAKEGVCGKLTQTAAKNMLNKVLDAKLGYNMNDLEAFDPVAFAKQRASEGLGVNGFDSRWLDNDKWGDIINDNLDEQISDLKSDVFY